jgi:hypothetical protein
MRARWDFFIDCVGIRFERTHKYKAQMTEQHARTFGLPNVAFEALIVIVPDDESKNPLIEQTGKLKITLPGNNEQTRNLAFWLAEKVAHQVTFAQGKVKINYGMVLGEHLPDTPEDESQINDTPFFGNVQLIEVLPTPTFDGSSIKAVSSNPLIQQFNDADHAKNPIDRYMGLFKILEDLYGPTSGKITLADALKSSRQLGGFAQQHLHMSENEKDRALNQTDYFQLVDKLVKARHECAHLRSQKNFGVTHGHPRVSAEIEPLIGPLRELAYYAIQNRS